MKENHKHRAIELGKDILILLLTCSALWLAAKTQLLGPLSNLLREDSPQTISGQSQGEEQVGSAVPMAMVVNIPSGAGLSQGPELPEGGESVRLGIAHDQAACQELFQQVAGILIETLSSVGPTETISRSQWEQTLTRQLGVYMDFQGEIPMPVLVSWLSGESTLLEGSVRRMVLTIYNDKVAICYRNEEDGKYYRTCSEMTDPDGLTSILNTLTDNGVFYAFESEEYEILNPDTLLFPDSPNLTIYTVSNPVSSGEESLQGIVEDLGFTLSSTSFYSSDQWVARSGDDSVRLSDRGVVEYTAGDENGVLPILNQNGGGGMLYNSVETCRQVAVALMGGRCGEARLYLSSVTQGEQGLEIDFGYSLNGIPVCFDQGYAARFIVSDGRIAQLTMHLRSYAANGTLSAVMPSKQALAAFSALELDGQELMLTYTDSGGDTVTAGWAARQETAGEG